MKDFKQCIQIIWRKNYIWLISLALLSILIKGAITNDYIDTKILDVRYSINSINLIYDKKEYEYEDDYGMSLESKLKEFKKNNFNKKEMEEAYSKFNQILIRKAYNTRMLENNNPYYYGPYGDNIKSRLSYIYNEYVKGNTDSLKLNANSNVFINPMVIFLAFILGFILISMEHLTPYYEFSRMFPWSHRKTYLIKVAFGLIYILAIYGISILIDILMLNNSVLKDIYYMDVFATNGILGFLGIIGIYLIIMGTASVSGNILGHFGMIIIAFLGIDLIYLNLYALKDIFNLSSTGLEHFVDFFAGLPSYIQVLLKPYLGLDNFRYNFWYLGLVGIIYLFLGYYWTISSKSERTGMLILKKSVSNFANFFAIVSTSSAIWEILYSSFYNFGLLVNSIIYIILIFITYKFYKILFKIKIGI